MKKRPHLILILQLKNLFKERNIPYPLIYNSYDLLLMLDKLHITNMYDLCLTTFDFTSLYTNISYHDTTRAIVMRCKLLLKYAKLLYYIGTIHLTSIKT